MKYTTAFVCIAILVVICSISFKFYNPAKLTDACKAPVLSAEKPEKEVFVNAHKSLKHIMDSLHIGSASIHILVLKSKYELSVWYNNTELKSYPVALGFTPVGDKVKQGDGCTPEGTFGIRAKYPVKDWDKFIWLDYPNAESWKKYNAAVKKGIIKPGTDIGGDIGIHGVPSPRYNVYIGKGCHWTHGCVSLTYEDTDELYDCISTQTTVEIRK